MQRRTIVSDELIAPNGAWVQWLRSIGVPVDDCAVVGVTIVLRPGHKAIVHVDIEADERMLDASPAMKADAT